MFAPLPRFERLPSPTVQLLHELPDGSSHIDWMIAREPAGVEPLVTFRLDRRLEKIEPGCAIIARHIGDHRPAYLDYEGPVSRHRGTVRRLCRGELNRVARPAHDATALVLGVRWGVERDALQQLKLKRLDSDQFSITCIAIHEGAAALAASLAKEES